MIERIEIKGYRGIRQGLLDHLTPVVVLVGPNNAGKTAVIEAIYIAAEPNPSNATQQIHKRSAFPQHMRWMTYSSRGERMKEATLALTTRAGTRTIRFIFQDPNNPSSGFGTNSTYVTKQPSSSSTVNAPTTNHMGGIPMSQQYPPDLAPARLIGVANLGNEVSIAGLWSELNERADDAQAKALIHDLLPDVEDVLILAPGGTPTLHLKYPDGARPLEIQGDGIKVLIRLICVLSAPSGSTILLEEPEIHLHPAAIRQEARAVLAAARRQVQVIITTHSIDLIDALLAEADPTILPLLSFYRLQLKDGQLTAVQTLGNDATTIRSQVQEDLR